MPGTGTYINQTALDSFNNVWIVGRDVSKLDGTVLTYYNYTNSSVPSSDPYYMDTRSISIDEDGTKWIGCAYSPSLGTPLVFTLEGPYGSTGQSWSTLEITGSTGNTVDVPTIYASPFGEEVLAFVSPLNGGYGTGPTGVYGVTGGDFYVYNKILQTWKEPAPGFSWPHIYDIKAKGILGSTYKYYLATSYGIYIIPEGDLKISYLEGGEPYIDQAVVWNSKNTSLPSDIIYSLDFDEVGNLWIGTDSGLVYWDQSKFYVWNSTSLSGLLSNQIYFVKSRPNGHVFFSAGNPEKGEGTGMYYFNGTTLINYNISNSGLPSNDIFSIMLAQSKTNSSGTVVYPNDVYFSAGNSVGLFDYTIPHIYATSKYAGTTGWNFVYYTPTTEALETDEARLPKANEYTWAYPSWETYQNSYLQYKHPGLNPINLFLEANLKAIADGRAGNQNYWNLGPIPNFDSIQLSQSLQNSSWVNGVTGGITKTTSVNYIDGKYAIGGYSSLDDIYFGLKNNLDPLVLINPNPTLPSYPRSGQKVGYVAYYNKEGQVQDVLTIRGYETEVWDIQSSRDEDSLYVLGSYKGYIEAGKLIYSSTYPGAGGITGPTGGPVGFSNIETPEITQSPYDYPWIYDGTQTVPATGPFIPATGATIDTSAQGIFLMEIERNLGDQTSYGGINFGVTGSLETSYRLKQFRHFPSASSSYNPNSTSSSIDTVLYERTLSLTVSKYNTDIVGTLKGGVSTYKDGWNRNLDNPSTDEFIFSAGTGSYSRSGFWISLGSDLELVKTEVTSGTGGDVVFNSVQKDDGTLTYLITGTSNSGSFDFASSTVSGGTFGTTGAFYLIANNTPTISSSNFIVTNSAPIDQYQGIDSGYRDGKYYWATFYSGTASFSTYTSEENPDYTGYSVLTAQITPSESFTTLHSNKILPVDLSVTNMGLDDLDVGKGGQRFYSIFIEGGTAVNYIWKTNPSSGMEGSIGIYGTGHARIALDSEDNLLIGGYRVGQTGPSSLPVDPSSFDSSFTALIPQYIPGTGIDLGNIISRAGSGAWTWADVHNSSSDLFVPVLSTVFLSNYSSQIFGKENNRWVLTDEFSGTVLLDVRSTPYFIYTFTEKGYYSVTNTVEDSNGNVYQVSKKALIKVADQSVASPTDPNPEFVNSVDYGYPPEMPRDKDSLYKLSKDLIEQQAQIRRSMTEPFGSSIVIPDDPYDVFRSGSTVSNRTRRRLIESISSKRRVDLREELRKLFKRFDD